MTRQFSTIAPATTTTGSLTNVATTIPLTAITGLPTTFPFTLVLEAGTGNAECVDVTSIATLTATVVRGTCGTTAVSHSSGATVTHMATGRDFQDIHNLLALDQSSVGVPAGGLTGFASPTGFRNAIINGCGAVAQRGFSTSTLASSSSAIAQRTGPDCWHVWRTGFTSGLFWTCYDYTVIAPPTGFQTFMRIQRGGGTSNLATCHLSQSIESKDSFRFRGRNACLTFWARKGANYSATSSLLGVLVYSGTGIDEPFNAGLTGVITELNATVTLTGSWQKFYIPTTAAMSSSLSEFGIDFNYTPTGTAGASDNFDITGIQFEDSIYPSAFDFRPYQVELALCQRRYWAYNIAAGGTNGKMGLGICASTTLAEVFAKFPVTMRTPPVLGPNGFTSGYLTVTDYVSTYSVTAVALTSANAEVASLTLTSSGMTLGRVCDAYVTGTNTPMYLEFIADI